MGTLPCLVVIGIAITQFLILLFRKNGPEKFAELRQTWLIWTGIWLMGVLMMGASIMQFKKAETTLVLLILNIAHPLGAGLVAGLAWHKKDQLIKKTREIV